MTRNDNVAVTANPNSHADNSSNFIALLDFIDSNSNYEEYEEFQESSMIDEDIELYRLNPNQTVNLLQIWRESKKEIQS